MNLTWIVLCIRLFDLKNAIIDHKIEDKSFYFQLVSMARPYLTLTSPRLY